MNRKPILSIVLLLSMLLALLSFTVSCDTAEETITVHVTIKGLEDELLCDKDVAVTGKDLSVKNALEQACIDIGLTLTYSSDGKKPIQIGEYVDIGELDALEEEPVEGEEAAEGEEVAEEEAAEEEVAEVTDDSNLYYWDYKVNGADPTQGGSSVQSIVEGDQIVWTWSKFDVVE